MSNNKNNIIAIVILSAVILLLSILCITLVYDKNNKETSINNVTPSYNPTEVLSEKTTNSTKPPKSSTEKSTTLTTTSTTPTVTVTEPTAMKIEIVTIPSQPTTEFLTEPYTNITATETPTENAEAKLAQLIKNSGYNIDDIEKQQTEQLIVITNDEVQTNAYMFSFADGIWTDEDITCKAYVGSAGIGKKQTNTDNITPAGLYSIGEAFYIDTPPSTWLNTFVITESTYWITDINSEMYNKKVEGEQTKDWNSAIYMIESESNRYGCVINYNTDPIVPGKGSAIFMHCGTDTTNGSIALQESDMLKFLEILNSEKNPNILIF